MSARTDEGRTLRLLTLIDEYTRECLAIRVERRMGSQEVIETLSDAMLWRGIPKHIRSDNGPEFIAQELRQWLANLGTGTLYIEPGSPWENASAACSGPQFLSSLLEKVAMYLEAFGFPSFKVRYASLASELYCSFSSQTKETASTVPISFITHAH